VAISAISNICFSEGLRRNGSKIYEADIGDFKHLLQRGLRRNVGVGVGSTIYGALRHRRFQTSASVNVTSIHGPPIKQNEF
jgi:hypothetical protein